MCNDAIQHGCEHPNHIQDPRVQVLHVVSKWVIYHHNSTSFTIAIQFLLVLDQVLMHQHLNLIRIYSTLSKNDSVLLIKQRHDQLIGSIGSLHDAQL